MLLIKKRCKYFIVLRGLPGAGKSTFAKDMFGDKATIICPDDIRLDYNGLITTLYGEKINQSNQGFIWKKTYELIEQSLLKNRITILDATSTREKDLLKCYDLVKDRKIYFFVVDFSDVSLEECKSRNKTRLPEYKRVEDFVLDRLYSNLSVPLSDKCTFRIYSHSNVKVE